MILSSYLSYFPKFCPQSTSSFFFLNDPAPTEFSPLPLPAALPSPIGRAGKIQVGRVRQHSRRGVKQRRVAGGLRERRRASGVAVEAGEVLRPDAAVTAARTSARSEEHTSELQSRSDLVCRLLLEKK